MKTTGNQRQEQHWDLAELTLATAMQMLLARTPKKQHPLKTPPVLSQVLPEEAHRPAVIVPNASVAAGKKYCGVHLHVADNHDIRL